MNPINDKISENVVHNPLVLKEKENVENITASQAGNTSINDETKDMSTVKKKTAEMLLERAKRMVESGKDQIKKVRVVTTVEYYLK